MSVPLAVPCAQNPDAGYVRVETPFEVPQVALTGNVEESSVQPSTSAPVDADVGSLMSQATEIAESVG